MKQPLHIQFHGMEASDAVESKAREFAAKLDAMAPDLMACRVNIDLEQKHKQQGRPYGVRIDLTLPGHELVVNKVQDEDVYVALRDAFDNMRRQLEGVGAQAPRAGKAARAGAARRGGARGRRERHRFHPHAGRRRVLLQPRQPGRHAVRARAAGQRRAVHPRGRQPGPAGQAREPGQARLAVEAGAWCRRDDNRPGGHHGRTFDDWRNLHPQCELRRAGHAPGRGGAADARAPCRLPGGGGRGGRAAQGGGHADRPRHRGRRGGARHRAADVERRAT